MSPGVRLYHAPISDRRRFVASLTKSLLAPSCVITAVLNAGPQSDGNDSTPFPVNGERASLATLRGVSR